MTGVLSRKGRFFDLRILTDAKPQSPGDTSFLSHRDVSIAVSPRGFLDIRRLSDMLVRVQDKIVHKDLPKISPFAVPVMLEVGKEPVHGASVEEAILREAEADLIADAMGMG